MGGALRNDFKRARVALALNGTIYPLLALSVSGDGGLIIDLAGCTPAEHFRYGVLDVPAGEGSWQALLREDEASWSVDVAPKLHYHRSGFISLDATKQLPKQGIWATPPSEITPNQ